MQDFEEANHLVKTCYVPSCKNTSKNSAKIFVNVPRRNHLNWFKFVGRNTVPVKQNLIWCCEDHFDVSSYSICLGFQMLSFCDTRNTVTNIFSQYIMAFFYMNMLFSN